MKFSLLCFSGMSTLLFSQNIYAETTYKEMRDVIFSHKKDNIEKILKPDENVTFPVKFHSSKETPTRKRIRIVGYVDTPRDELLFRNLECLIDDNLDAKTVKNDTHSLYYRGENKPIKQHAYNRIPGKLIQEGSLTIEIQAKRKDLKINKEGNFGVEVEVFLKKEGRHEDDVYDTPDKILFLPIPAGTSKDGFETITKTFDLPKNVACLLVRVGGTSFDGECWVEAPHLIQKGQPLVSFPFVKRAKETDNHNYWVGINIATRSWPRWNVSMNGKTLFESNVFDRASNVTDIYLPLPSDTPNEGEMTLTLIDESPRTSFPYKIREVEAIEETARDFEVISISKFPEKGQQVGLLVETNKPNQALSVKTDSDCLTPKEQTVTLKNPGLHVVPLTANKTGEQIPVSITQGNRTENVEIQQIIEKNKDGVYLSSGDEIYIDKIDYDTYNQFFKWYISNRIGNWYQFRPSYDWSGFRTVDKGLLKHYIQLLNQLAMPYAWQVEGRSLAAEAINPDLKTLDSPLFQGKQAHENDGGYYYWGHFKYVGLFSDMAARSRPYGGIFARHRPIHTDHGTFIHYDPQGIKDMEQGAKTLVENFKYSRGESTRHTGPSTLFRYLFQAGYDWLGAEQMYGPEETIMSSLRGASKAYGKKDYGSLHAMQWGSFPFTDPKHSLRHYMSMVVAYMHGSSHINTEEALWIDEFANDRFSPSGKEHLVAQHKIMDFIETHSRRGSLNPAIAVIQGRNDAWKSFGRGSVWSQKGEKWAFNKACESFDLVKVFYPENDLNSCGPGGWFTSTPYGPIDLLPIEATQELMNNYKVMIFLGWNTYNSEDFARLKDFVQQGGTLLLTAAHINSELQPDIIPQFPKNDKIVRDLLGNDYASLTEKTERKVGKGTVVYFPAKSYPAEESLRMEYEKAMRSIASKNLEAEANKGWVAAAPHIGFTAWDEDNRRTLYLLNIDWKSDQIAHPATFLLGDKTFPVQVRQYHTETIHCASSLGIMPGSNTTDVLEIKETPEGWSIKVQSTEPDELQIFNAHSGEVKKLDLKKAGIHDLKLMK